MANEAVLLYIRSRRKQFDVIVTVVALAALDSRDPETSINLHNHVLVVDTFVKILSRQCEHSSYRSVQRRPENFRHGDCTEIMTSLC